MTTPEIVTTPRACWKLTDERGRTYKGTQWGPGITRRTDGRGDLCGPGWLHFYDHPLLAVLLNPIHAAFKAPRLWRATYSGAALDDRGLKRGASVLTTVEEVPLPVITPAQAVCFGILCAYAVTDDHEWRAYAVTDDHEWREWADRWLSGEDRSPSTAIRIGGQQREAVFYAAYAVYAASRGYTGYTRSGTYVARAADSAVYEYGPLDLAAAAEWAVSWPGLDGERL